MIHKANKPGASFRRALAYDFRPEKRPSLLGGTMAGQTPRELASEFGALRAMREGIRKPVFQASLSAAPDDHLDEQAWLEIAEEYLGRLGYGNSLWVAVRHGNTDVDHIHLVASRIDCTGVRVDSFQEWNRGQEILRALEVERGLTRVAPSSEARRSALSWGELATFERTGEVSVKTRLQEHLDCAARDRPSMSLFVDRLAAQGVGVRPVIASTGRASGISFELDGIAVKGSRLGRSYSWLGLQRHHGITYDSARDLPRLEAARAASATAAPRLRAAPEPKHEPMPPVRRLTDAYRASAVLTVGLELHRRTDRLDRESHDLGAQASDARDFFNRRRRLTSELAERTTRASEIVSASYADPRAADRFKSLLERHGYEHAANLLERDPARLGRLRGTAIAGLQSQERRDALLALRELARELRQLAAMRSEFVLAQPLVAAVDSRLGEAERQGRALEQCRVLLPPPAALRHDIARAARTLDLRLARAVIPRSALPTLNTALRMVERATRHLARDDHGLDL